MKSSSLKLLESQQIENPRAYRDMLIHDFYLPVKMASGLDKFYLSEEDFLPVYDSIKDGEIVDSGRIYSVIWINHPSAIRKNGRAMLSFRYCKILQRGYCLIKEYKEREKERNNES